MQVLYNVICMIFQGQAKVFNKDGYALWSVFKILAHQLSRSMKGILCTYFFMYYQIRIIIFT